MEKSKIKSFIKRVATTLVLVPVVIFCILAGYPLINTLAFLGAVLLSWEWANMVKNNNPSFYMLSYVFSVTVFIFVGYPIIGLVFMLLTLAIAVGKSKGEENRGLLLLGIPYISIGLGSIIEIYNIFGPHMIIWFMFLVWGVDIGGYLFGCTLKGPKLAPKISPNKTWSGLIGGVLLSVAMSYLVCWFFDVASWEMSKPFTISAAFLAVIAQVGDLIESYIKRRMGVKDSSNIIPGHGGIFDRIDGLIFAAPFAFIILVFILEGFF